MTRCQGYGTVAGCGRCTVNLALESDLALISPISVLMIVSDLLETGEKDMGVSHPKDADVRCDGIIVLPLGSIERGHESYYKQVLTEWRDASRSTCTTDEERQSIERVLDAMKTERGREDVMALLRREIEALLSNSTQDEASIDF